MRNSSPSALIPFTVYSFVSVLPPHTHAFQGKGFAFVQFVIPEDVGKALEQLDRHAFHGRLLHIIPARRQPGSSGAEVAGKAGR